MRKILLALTLALTLLSCGKNKFIQKNAELRSLELAPDATTVMVSYKLNGQYYIWLDGKVQGPYDFIFYPRFSESREKPELLTTYQKQGEWFIRFAGFKYGPYGGDTQAPRVDLSSDNDIAISFKKDGMEYILYNDRVLGPYSKTGGWIWSRDNRDYAFWYVDEIEFAYEVNGVKTTAGKEYAAPFFKADNSLGLISSVNKELFLTLDNRRLGPYEFALPPVYSATGKDFALMYDKGGSSWILSKRKNFGPFVNILGSPAFSPDESALSFIYTKNTNEYEYYLHLAGEELGPYQYVLPVKWSDQGPAYAFLFAMANGLYLNYKGEISGPWSRLTDIEFMHGDLHLATVVDHEVMITNLH